MTFKLKSGDTKRELTVKFRQNGKLLTEEPSSVVMNVKVGETIEPRVFTNSGPSEWFYRPEAADYAVFASGNVYEAEFELTWADGTKATAPTSGRAKLKIEAVLS